MITAVKTDPSERHRGMSLLVIERGMEGFERGRNLEFPIARACPDARITTIYGGTTEIMKEIIGRRLGV